MYIWGCPINAVLKVLLKIKLRPVGDKIQKNELTYIKMS